MHLWNAQSWKVGLVACNNGGCVDESLKSLITHSSVSIAVVSPKRETRKL